VKRPAPGFARGFTLAEALAALLLVAIVLPVAMNGVSLGVHAARDARRRLQAASLAQSKLSELVATAAWQGSQLQGDFAVEQVPGYTWEAVVEEWEEPGMKQLSVVVRWQVNDSPQQISVATLVPAESQ
jgi:general secretion pathway protein I